MALSSGTERKLLDNSFLRKINSLNDNLNPFQEKVAEASPYESSCRRFDAAALVSHARNEIARRKHGTGT